MSTTTVVKLRPELFSPCLWPPMQLQGPWHLLLSWNGSVGRVGIFIWGRLAFEEHSSNINSLLETSDNTVGEFTNIWSAKYVLDQKNTATNSCLQNRLTTIDQPPRVTITHGKIVQVHLSFCTFRRNEHVQQLIYQLWFETRQYTWSKRHLMQGLRFNKC